jgi:hypothetical protein
MWIVDIVSVIALAAAVLASPFLLIGWSNSLAHRKEERPFPLKSTIAFVVPLAISALCYGVSTFVAECQVAEFLESTSSKCIVSIDGHVALNRDEILAILRTMEDLPAHHSSPTRRIRVDVADPPRKLVLLLARDSGDSHEYWIFAPSATRFSYDRDIGHIKTALFDEY